MSETIMPSSSESVNGTNNTPNVKRPLNMRRRRALHQILCQKDITPRTRVIARTIAALEYGDDQGRSSTSASDLTIARKAGRQLNEATQAVKELEAAGHLHIRKREGRRYMHLILRDDIDVLLPPISGDRSFFKGTAWRDQIKRRERLIDEVFADPDLTDGAKLIAYAMITLANVHTARCYETTATIAAIVGLNQSTAVRAISRLIKSRYIVRTVDGYALPDILAPRGADAQSMHSRCAPDARSMHGLNENARFTGTSEPRSGYSADSGTLQRNTLHSPTAASAEWEILTAIAEYGCDGRMHIGGVINFLGKGYGITACISFADDIKPMIDAGYLCRVDYHGAPSPSGQYVELTEAGYAYLNPECQKEAA